MPRDERLDENEVGDSLAADVWRDATLEMRGADRLTADKSKEDGGGTKAKETAHDRMDPAIID